MASSVMSSKTELDLQRSSTPLQVRRSPIAQAMSGPQPMNPRRRPRTRPSGQIETISPRPTSEEPRRHKVDRVEVTTTHRPLDRARQHGPQPAPGASVTRHSRPRTTAHLESEDPLAPTHPPAGHGQQAQVPAVRDLGCRPVASARRRCVTWLLNVAGGRGRGGEAGHPAGTRRRRRHPIRPPNSTVRGVSSTSHAFGRSCGSIQRHSPHAFHLLPHGGRLVVACPGRPARREPPSSSSSSSRSSRRCW